MKMLKTKTIIAVALLHLAAAAGGAMNAAATDEATGDAVTGGALKALGYDELTKKLSELDARISKGESWSKVSSVKKKIEPGMTAPQISEVRRRLESSGDIPPFKRPAVTAVVNEGTAQVPLDPEFVYDDDLVAAVKVFQKNNGLEVDGVIGAQSVEAMNVSIEDRACQLKVNLERLSGMAADLGAPKYVLVNVPAMSAYVMEGGRSVLDTKVIIGRRDRKTPLLTSAIRYIIFSPKWHVPLSIAVKDKLPILKEDPGYIGRMHMTVYAKDEEKWVEVDPSTIDWTAVNSEEFPYRIVQSPGDINALGRVKFMFPNQHDVYMHDTPEKSLFTRDMRTFSSGCIRVEKPVELAKYFLKDKPEWTEESIAKAMNRESVLYVDLSEPVPVYIVYLTAWIDSDGNVIFYRDIYNKDQSLKQQVCK